AGAADQFSNLYVVPIGGGAPYKLTFGAHDSFHPRWSPDGEWIASIANEGGLPALWLLETYGGKRTRVAIAERRWKRPMGKLHVRLEPLVEARIHGRASDGKFYAPTDAYSRLGRSALHSFHTGGEFTVEVPPGPVAIEAVRGFEYKPATATFEVRAGQTTEGVIRMERVFDFAQKGWRSASTHVHMNYGGNLHNTPANLRYMARAEGLDLVMDLVANKDNRILDHQFFGRDTPEIHFGEEYRPPFYGHVFFLGLRDHLISPFTTGYEGTAIESLYPSNTDMFRKARAQGAINGYVHAFYGDNDPLNAELGVAKAFPVDVALGTVDCVEWSGSSRSSLKVWHHALNNDFAVTPTGGEDSITNLHRTKLIGSVRTYAHTGGDARLDLWLDALRKGHTFFSTGPLVEFRINNSLPGESVRLPAGGGTVTMEAMVESIAPLSTVVIHRNGEVFRKLPASNGPWREQVKVTGSAWFSLYVEGPPYRYLDAEFPQAATNAIRVYAGDERIRTPASADYFVKWIAKLSAMAEAWPWWRSDREKAHVLGQFAEASKVYERLR
ncbi:MAG: CehA/McbA family metallohydrolase, partial [Bryobacteraceae bacterium]